MRRYCLLVFCLFTAGAALADDRSECAAADGAFLSGTVATAPAFVHGQFLHGVELSHSRFDLAPDGGGATYQVAVDNIFANGYQAGGKGVPAALAGIAVGDRLALCGALYTKGRGIHFVHTNCGDAPTPEHPNGWLRRVDGKGEEGPNLEAGQAYCSIFGHAGR